MNTNFHENRPLFVLIRVNSMRVRKSYHYFSETDTLYVELSDKEVVETRDLSENIIVDLDAEDNLVAFTAEHAVEFMKK